MPAGKDATTLLAEKMVLTLEEERRQGGDRYPLTVRRLAELADSLAPPERVAQAAGKRALTGRAVVAVARNLDSPVALGEDVELLAGSSLLLDFLLQAFCNPVTPACDLALLRAKLGTKLKKPFDAAVRHRVESGTLPPGVAAIVGKRGALALHLLRYPLPQPPEVQLAENLARVLQAQRQLGGSAYPLLLGRLVELTQAGVATALLKKALAQPSFQTGVVLAIPKAKDLLQSPITLLEDGGELAGCGLVLEAVLKSLRTDATQVRSLADLKKKIAPALQQPWQADVVRRIEGRALPAGVGCLRKGASLLLFLTADVIAGQESVERNRAPSPIDFARAFDEVFGRLEQEARMPNWVNLADLRRALPVDPLTFDAELRKLRQDGRYTLSAAEGRHGISPEEQRAGIREDGALLLFVSRKRG